jgi:hypothetical protein
MTIQFDIPVSYFYFQAPAWKSLQNHKSLYLSWGLGYEKTLRSDEFESFDIISATASFG